MQALPAIIGLVGSIGGALLSRPGKAPAPIQAPPAPTIDTARQTVNNKHRQQSAFSLAANRLVKSETGVATTGRNATGY